MELHIYEGQVWKRRQDGQLFRVTKIWDAMKVEVQFIEPTGGFMMRDALAILRFWDPQPNYQTAEEIADQERYTSTTRETLTTKEALNGRFYNYGAPSSMEGS